MPNNQKIKRNRGRKDFGIHTLVFRAKPKIIRDRICKKSRRKRMEKQRLVALGKQLDALFNNGLSRASF